MLKKQDDMLYSVVGSPAYMDERIMKNEDYGYDLTADIYSLGLVYSSIFNIFGKGIYD